MTIIAPDEVKHRLNVGQMIDEAREMTGLSDFGDRPLQEGLSELVACAARDNYFHVAGLEVFRNELVRCLVNRLRMQRDITRHPEILDEDVSDPIVVIGLGRSGTTKLHKMLSAPDSVQKSFFWRLWSPGRPADQPPGDPDLRIAVAGLSPLIEGKPIPDSAHVFDKGEVDEDGLLYMLTFEDFVWNYMTLSPSYFDLCMKSSSVEPYRYVREMLQYLQWQDGGKRDRPWVLKSIMHIANLDILLDTYPNATVVFPHRDPIDTVPSLAKWQAIAWTIQAAAPDLPFVGRETLRMRRIATDRCLKARADPQIDGRILDVPYEMVRTDPMAIITQVYDRAGRKLTDAAYNKMQAWHDDNEQGKFGKHEYSLEEFGLTKADIDNAFSDYIGRFIRR